MADVAAARSLSRLKTRPNGAALRGALLLVGEVAGSARRLAGRGEAVETWAGTQRISRWWGHGWGLRPGPVAGVASLRAVGRRELLVQLGALVKPAKGLDAVILNSTFTFIAPCVSLTRWKAFSAY